MISVIDLQKQTLLVIAPHADDEILGCGGLMSKVKEAGGKVHVLIFNVGSVAKTNQNDQTEIWKTETESAMKFLNVDSYDTVFDSSSDNRYLDSKPLFELINAIESTSKVSLDAINPSMVAIPTNFSHHQDHVKVFEACIAALRPLRGKIPELVFSYEAPEHSRWSVNGTFEPNLYLDIEKHLELKISAFYEYKSQIKDGIRDKISITTQAAYRGNEIGRKYCEAFHCHRLIC